MLQGRPTAALPDDRHRWRFSSSFASERRFHSLGLSVYLVQRGENLASRLIMGLTVVTIGFVGVMGILIMSP